MKKVLVGIIIVAVAGAVLWQAHKRIQAVKGAKKTERRDVPVAVETQPVRKGTIRDISVFTGSLVPESQFVVAPKAAGWIKELLVDIGDSVGRNEVVAVLDDAEFTQDVEQARAELQVARANAENSISDLDLAKREYERVQALREKQIASAAELDTSASAYNAGQSRLKVAQAQVTQKEAALKAAELKLSYTQVRAFWEDGDPNRVVGERFVDEGTLVQTNQAIVSILENNPLTAVVFVIERDYPKVRLGQQAVITTDAWPGRTFAGAVRRIAPLLKETSRQARLEIEIANPEHLLKPGMFVRAQLEFDRHDNATLVPLSAVVRRDGREGVFLVDDSSPVAGRSSPEARAREPSDKGRATRDEGQATTTLRARFIPVTAGIVNGETVEVAEPQLSGTVVTLGNHLVEDGSRITLPQAPPVAGRPSLEQDARKPRDEGRGTGDKAKRGGRR